MDTVYFKIEVQGLDQEIQNLGRLQNELTALKQAKVALDKEYAAGKITFDKYNQSLGTNKLQQDAVKLSIKEQNASLNAQAQAVKGAEGSMTRLSYELGQMKERYRNLSEAERENAQIGGVLLRDIQQRDAEIKRLDATIGNHQRKVADYATAWKGVGSSVLGFTGVAGAATLAAGALVSAMKEGVQGALEDERANKKLLFALGGNIEAMQRMTTLKDRLFDTTTFSEDEIRNAITYAAEMGRTEAEMKRMIVTAAGMSRVLGIDIQKAMEQLNATYEGNIGKLGKLDVSIKNLSDSELAHGGAVDLLYDKYLKFSTSGIDTAAGQVKKFTQRLSEFFDETSKWSLDRLGDIALGLKAIFIDFNVLAERRNQLWAGEIKGMVDTQSQVSMMKQQVVDFTKVTDGISKERQKARQEILDVAKDQEAGIISYNDAWQKRYTIMQQFLNAEELNRDKNKSDAEKAQRDAENKAEREKAIQEDLRQAATENARYLEDLARKTIDNRIMVMEDGYTKEVAIENKKLEDNLVSINRQKEDKVKQIDELLSKAKKGSDEEKKLLEQKVEIEKQTDLLIQSAREQHLRTLQVIESKSSPEAKDAGAMSKMSDGVQAAKREYEMKLEGSRQYYASLGNLTKEQTQQQHDAELQLFIDLQQKKFDLLKAEIEARRQVGFASEEELANQQAILSQLYTSIQGAKDNLKSGENKGGKGGNKITGFMSDLFGITDSEASAILGQVQQLGQQIIATWQGIQQQKVEAELVSQKAKIDKEYSAEVQKLDKMRKAGTISQEMYEKRKAQLEEQSEKRKRETEKKAFEQNKKLQVTNIWINAAVAVINALAQMGPILGGIMGALILVTAGIQASEVNSRKFPEYAKGGIVVGNSHANGGEKFSVGGRVVELEGGEGVINKRSMSSSDILSITGTPFQIASEINSHKGYGKHFDMGGVTPSPTPVRRTNTHAVAGDIMNPIMTEVVKLINTQRVVVLESDITDAQESIKKIKTESVW